MCLSRRATVLASLAALTSRATRPPQAGAATKLAGLKTELGRTTVDFDQLLKARVLRVLVPYSRTLFFQDRGQLYGTAAQVATRLEDWINKTYRLGSRPLTVALIPTSRDRLFDDLLAGVGDVAGGDITITAVRRQRVAFTNPTQTNVKEVVITGADQPDLADAEALSGMPIATRRSTSFYESLDVLNQRLVAAAKTPAELIIVPDTLESEDMMEMVSAGLLPAIVVDDWIADLWVSLLKGIKVQRKAVLRDGVEIAWAVRPDNPQLLAMLNKAIAEVGGDPKRIGARTRQYLTRLKQLYTATSEADLARFQATLEIFRRYAGEYGFDTLLLVAQSYQESRLDQNARSRVGAIGLMQLMPATGNLLGVGDIRRADPNVHAGAKYMAHLIDTYFKGETFDQQNRTLFAFAAYNAGPGEIHSLQAIARQRGYDPSVWFDNVERVAAEKVGQEPVRYVRNIYKYYVAYKLIEDADTARRAATPAHG